MTTKHVYHYCAMAFLPKGNTQYITGVASFEDPILDYQAYCEVSDSIASTHDLDHVTITSLTLLGTKEEE